MKFKRLLSLFVAVLICFSSFTALATENTAAQPLVMSAPGQNDSIDYSDMSNWAYWNEGENKGADLFFVCPTVDMGKGGNFNADIQSEKYRESFVGAINMELGIYSEVSSVYAPYYRQATFPVYSLSSEEQEKYLSFAYEDVKNAFIYYADHTDASRPLILAGFSQGADLTIRLIKDLFDEPKYQNRLVAAYAIGWKITENEVKEYPHLKPATGETDTGVVIAFNSEDKNITSSLIIGENEKTYAINPLNWKTTSEIADKILNKGACFTDYSGNVKEEIPNLTGAYIDQKRGALKVTDINPQDYPGKLFEDGIYHLYDYQFFFRNLQENVKTRLEAFNKKNPEQITVYYNDEIMSFDVEPIAENGRTLVPFRTIFEAMGCAVYYSVENEKQIVSARRGNNSLVLTIGENKMYFNGNEIALDVPAKIKDNRTLIPLRAISEAFDCEVHWYGNTKSIYIYSPAEAYAVSAKKIAQTITDDKGNILIEALAYYPVIDNSDNNLFVEEINGDYKLGAENFLEEAKAKKEDALTLQREMGEAFTPFVYEMTFEQNYNIFGDLSFTNYKYTNLGGVHPWVIKESKNFSVTFASEMSLLNVIDEKNLGVSLTDYVTNLFANKFKEISPEAADIYTADYVKEYIGNLQFYLTPNSVVLYFNQGEVAPYALGTISVEIPYNPQWFYVDMTSNCLDEYVYEPQRDADYEWRVLDYAADKLIVSNDSSGNLIVKGVKKGNAALILAHVKKGEDAESATQLIIASFYVDKNNKITLVAEHDGRFLLN